MTEMQDVFISHSSIDKKDYVLPLAAALTAKGVTYWLDASEIHWGDSIVWKINEGLQTCRRVLLCLSKNYLERPWPRAEMESVLGQQIDSSKMRVLPLILNSREEVLAAYPLLRSLAYRLFDQDVESIAEELATLCAAEGGKKTGLHIRIESAHSGRLCDVIENPAVSVSWLASKARSALGGRETADAGSFELFPMRWVLVDVEAEEYWRGLSESDQRKIWALVKVGSEHRTATEGTMSLERLGVRDDIVFHLYGIALGHVVLMKEPCSGGFDII